MMFPEDILAKIAVFALASCGFVVARHIYKHKKSDQSPLVCPLNFDCHAVVHSDYSKFLGVPVEIFGMIYYGLVSISYLIFIFMPNVLPPFEVGVVIISSLAAFIFSLYLICVQIFILKKGCFWCYISALICVLIFILTVFSYDFSAVVQAIIK